MPEKYAFENLLRSPWELLVSAIGVGFGLLCVVDHSLIAVHFQSGCWIALAFFALAFRRAYQGGRVLWYRKRLLTLTPFSLSTREVPVSKAYWFLGKGFRWLPIHRQRMHLLSLVHNQAFMQKNRLYRWVERCAHENTQGFCARLQNLSFLPFKARPSIGGKPWIHGVGNDSEQSILLPQGNRNSHTVIFGMTRVGKTRLLSILVNQDIRNGEAVLVIDPKGDLEVIQDMYSACHAAGRLKDFKILHAGLPDVSAKYNPLLHYTNVSEVATRITNAIDAKGEGKQFQDFAWKFLNITATCLAEMNEPISYKSLAFFVTRPRQLLLAYCDRLFPSRDPKYSDTVNRLIEESQGKLDKRGNPVEPLTRSKAVQQYVKQCIESTVSEGGHSEYHDSIIADLHQAASMGEEYYGKITASLGPVFDKINKTDAGGIFSWDQGFGLPSISLEEVIKKKQVVYIGLDAMSNKAMSEAVSQAVISDLISLCGRLYKEVSSQKRTLCLHADEFSEMVRDEFITLVNKAGGAGIQVSAYTQTVNDLGVAFGAGSDKPKMLLGNFGTTVMMRIANQDTAKVFTECLENVQARSNTPSTMSNDHPDGEGGELFTTYNTDTVGEYQSQLVVENDLFSLPKGQAFVLTDGGTLYKIRIPLPRSEGERPASFERLLYEVNLCSEN